jgi:hypothetical protein
MENGNLVSGTAQLMHQGRADETVAADQKDSHTRLDESVSIPVIFYVLGQFVGARRNTL